MFALLYRLKGIEKTKSSKLFPSGAEINRFVDIPPYGSKYVAEGNSAIVHCTLYIVHCTLNVNLKYRKALFVQLADVVTAVLVAVNVVGIKVLFGKHTEI